MKQITGFWIRKNKNVQVRCRALDEYREGVNHTVRVSFRNGHVRYIDRKQFLDEFISLDDLLAEITKDSRWISMSSKHRISVTDIRLRMGVVFYRISGVPEEYSFAGIDIQKFKEHFKPDLSEVAK